MNSDPPTIAALPQLSLDPGSLADRDADLSREWLLTNGLGGYALGTICGATTRAYHGLLVAAVRPPVDRAVLVAKIDETVTLPGGAILRLGTNEYADATIYPRGFTLLSGFRLEGTVPCFTYRLAPDTALEKRIWMEHGHNITLVHYRHVSSQTEESGNIGNIPRSDGVEVSADSGNIGNTSSFPPLRSVSSVTSVVQSPDPASIVLSLAPFCLDRDHHGVTHGSPDWHFLVEAAPSACTVRAFAGALPYRLVAGPSARFTPTGEWNWHIFHRAERDRGLPDTEDAYMPGTFAMILAPGDSATLVLTAEPNLPDILHGIGTDAHESTAAASLQRLHDRELQLLAQAGPQAATDPFFARLTLAADQFLVARASASPPLPGEGFATNSPPLLGEGPGERSVIAGYPWFTDWGRDTMIALSGLTLATGRHAEARGLLLTFAHYISRGMIPNRFPEAGAEPAYNSADATLWYFHALGAYLDATQDWPLLAALFPKLEDVVAWHVRGTRYGIGVDPADGLLRAGGAGVQLTWMDAKVGDWVVTPRWGKPVEINALWHRALALMGAWSRRLDRDPAHYDTLLAAIERSFLPRFWYPAGGYLYDVVDVEGTPGAVDWSLRPNQLFALALSDTLVPPDRAHSILDVVERELLTPLGLRTLAPDDPRFVGSYGGDQRARDAAYHQGAVWPWLLGAYAEPCRRFRGGSTDIAALLAPFQAHLLEAGIGTVSEIADGAPPFYPRGCPAQAWSVAELLRLAAYSP
ncbi:MAG TPA: amylo-alpha-1,6-glucosidase [Ktedonobacterales bacterium]|nr:amylo-alpha-1,6-glucosidase [Ktedonobacterales bacterium]